MSEDPEAVRRERLRREAEHRAIVQATMQARRAGKLPKVHHGASEVITALAVVVTLIATLVIAFRYGN